MKSGTDSLPGFLLVKNDSVDSMVDDDESKTASVRIYS
jgi:hypothetical protein